jgi:hypothetical protein
MLETQSGNSGEARGYRLLKVALWFVALATGILQIWLQDYAISDDALSYLDSGDMLWHRDIANAITAHWSPGLPFLLGLALKLLHPVGLWEVAVVKLVDLIIFLFTLTSFDFFLNQWCRFQDNSAVADVREAQLLVPKKALITVGYLLFIWTITRWLPASWTSPDMLEMGVVFVIFRLLLKIRMGTAGFASFAILGVVLGCGYLIKTPMFPLAFLFLGSTFLLVRDYRIAIPRVAVAFGLFAIIAAPLVIELSKLTGSLTFGKSGAWNYARYVDGIALPFHWRGLPEGSGKPLHPTRIIFQDPTIYEFGSPVRGTFPPWRDPYYWYAGITPHFNFIGQWRVLKGNAKYLEVQVTRLNPCFIYGFLILLFMSAHKGLIGRILMKQWFLLLPSIAALAMFSIVLLDGRYIAPYPIVIGLVAFSGVAVVRSATSVKLVNCAVLLAAASFAVSSARPAAGALLSFAKSLNKDEILSRNGPWHVSSEAVSETLRARGVKPGDRIAYIGQSTDFYWARLAGVEVNAEIRQWGEPSDPWFLSLVPKTSVSGLERSVDIYWALSPEKKEKVDHILYGVGSTAIVTDAFPMGGDATGWNNIPGTSFYIHLLQDRDESDNKRPGSPLLPNNNKPILGEGYQRQAFFETSSTVAPTSLQGRMTARITLLARSYD